MSPRLLPVYQKVLCHHDRRDLPLTKRKNLHKEDSGYQNVPACLKDAGEKDGWEASQIGKGSSKEKQSKLSSHASQTLSFLSTLRGYD